MAAASLNWNEFRKVNKGQGWSRETMSQNYQAQLSEEDKQEGDEVLKQPYKMCIDPTDYIDGAEWEDDDVPDMVFIRDPRIKVKNKNDNETPQYICYKREYLLKSLHQKENRLAKWVGAHDNQGHGGKASKKPEDQYVKLFPNRYLLRLDVIAMINEDERSPSLYELVEDKETGLVKVGNLNSQLGVSDLHGQHPAEPVYQLKEIKHRGIKVKHVERIPYEEEKEEPVEEEKAGLIAASPIGDEDDEMSDEDEESQDDEDAESEDDDIPEEKKEEAKVQLVDWTPPQNIIEEFWKAEGFGHNVAKEQIDKSISEYSDIDYYYRHIHHGYRAVYPGVLVDSPMYKWRHNHGAPFDEETRQEDARKMIVDSLHLLKQMTWDERTAKYYPFILFEAMCRKYPWVADHVQLVSIRGVSLWNYDIYMKRNNPDFQTSIKHALYTY